MQLFLHRHLDMDVLNSVMLNNILYSIFKKMSDQKYEGEGKDRFLWMLPEQKLEPHEITSSFQKDASIKNNINIQLTFPLTILSFLKPFNKISQLCP